MKKIQWHKYPVRTCIWMNECRLCAETISSGQRYYDGGHGRRAHCECANEEMVDDALESKDTPGAGREE